VAQALLPALFDPPAKQTRRRPRRSWHRNRPSV